MPFSCRGAQYYGEAHAFLNCRFDHDQIANKLYEELAKKSEFYGNTDCPGCGAFITVSRRGGGEWEVKVFSRSENSTKER